MEFNIEKAASGKAAVTTEQGDSVRIIATDIPGLYPVVAYVKAIGDAYGSVQQFTKDGRPQNPREVSKLILEKKKHKGWINLYSLSTMTRDVIKLSSVAYDSYEEAKKNINALQSDDYINTIEIEWEA